MKYKNIVEGKFVSRENRFISVVNINGKNEICHVKNTGRCKELLTPNAKVYLEEFESSKRKTKYDLVSVWKNDVLINMDSQAPNKVFYEWIKEGNFFKNVTLIKPETKYKNSRFDFYIEYDNKKAFAEVKGVTLEEDGVLKFPDAPTRRGVKHLKELLECKKDGFDAYVFFVVQLNYAKYFTPNYTTHKEFGDTLKYVTENGVIAKCVKCDVKKDELKITNFVEINL